MKRKGKANAREMLVWIKELKTLESTVHKAVRRLGVCNGRQLEKPPLSRL